MFLVKQKIVARDDILHSHRINLLDLADRENGHVKKFRRLRLFLERLRTWGEVEVGYLEDVETLDVLLLQVRPDVVGITKANDGSENLPPVVPGNIYPEALHNCFNQTIQSSFFVVVQHLEFFVGELSARGVELVCEKFYLDNIVGLALIKAVDGAEDVLQRRHVFD